MNSTKGWSSSIEDESFIYDWKRDLYKFLVENQTISQKLFSDQLKTVIDEKCLKLFKRLTACFFSDQEKLFWEGLPYLPYSPDIVPFEFLVYGHIMLKH